MHCSCFRQRHTNYVLLCRFLSKSILMTIYDNFYKNIYIRFTKQYMPYIITFCPYLDTPLPSPTTVNRFPHHALQKFSIFASC